MVNVSEIINKLSRHYASDRKTTLNRMRENPNPFRVLIGCLVSINIKDEVCEEILEELFSKADSFGKIIDMNQEELENILYRARYRKIKANTLKSVSREIIERFGGNVPDNEADLLSIKGIGPKTCNVVLNFAFGQNKIPVDSNTLRISNRIGWINTDKHNEVEKLLVANLDAESLRNANAAFMLHGKEVCVPISPFCSKCPIEDVCMKIGVSRSR